MKREQIRRFRRRIIGIRDGRRIFSRDKERIWKRRQKISENSRIEEVGTERKNDKGVCQKRNQYDDMLKAHGGKMAARLNRVMV